jgi:exonuclease SbcC
LGGLFDEGTETLEPDQPLVQFARDLLNLDLLENITDGLRVILDLRRLDNVSDPYRRLKEERRQLNVTRPELVRSARASRSVFEDALTHVEALFEREISRHGHVKWTQSTLRSRREAVASERETANRRERIDSLQQSRGSLETALNVLVSESPSSGEQKQVLREMLAVIEQERDTARSNLATVVARLEGLLMEVSPKLVSELKSRAIEVKLDHYEAEAKRTLSSARAGLTATADLRARLDAAIRRRSDLQDELQSATESPSVGSAPLREWRETLTAVSRNVHDEHCPVCQRDYSELGLGSLKAQIELQIERLGGDVKRLNDLASRRSLLEAELVQLSTLADVLNEQLKSQSVTHSRNLVAEYELTIVLEQELPALSADRERLSESISRATEISRQINNLQSTEEQYDRLKTQIAAIATLLDVPQSHDLREWAAAAALTVESRIEELTKQEIRATALLDALTVAEKRATELTQSEARLTALEAHGIRIEEAWTRADGCIREAKILAEAATRAKKTLVEEIFEGTLNDLWRDLFRRLVKSDRFTPQLRLERQGRQLRTQIKGYADGIEPFEHAGSVLSAGNFNTAALSLFLSVHLLEKPKHQLLVLDDPVQNMDDVHVVQLASLLRTIVVDSGRQLIVGVHERGLFDYLCLELGPTSASHSLCAIEIIGGAEPPGTEIRAERRVWQDDKLQLGA